VTSPPDWGRAGVHGMSGKIGPLGDPTRWGAALFQQVPFNSAGPHTLESAQIIAAACQDGYARNWSIIGVVGTTAAVWAMLDGTGPDTWRSSLSVRLGASQNTIVHNVNLRATIDADAPFYNDSPPITAPSLVPPAPGVILRVRAYVIPGAFVANVLSVQVVNIVEYILPPLPDGDAIYTAIQIAPIMAGSGL
jgi:hypothetical protein